MAGGVQLPQFNPLAPDSSAQYAQQNQLLQGATNAGYMWDPVQNQYVRTPQSLGAAQNTYQNAANPALAGLYSSIQGLFGGGAGGSTSSGTKTSTSTGT